MEKQEKSIKFTQVVDGDVVKKEELGGIIEQAIKDTADSPDEKNVKKIPLLFYSLNQQELGKMKSTRNNGRNCYDRHYY